MFSNCPDDFACRLRQVVEPKARALLNVADGELSGPSAKRSRKLIFHLVPRLRVGFKLFEPMPTCDAVNSLLQFFVHATRKSRSPGPGGGCRPQHGSRVKSAILRRKVAFLRARCIS